MLPLGRWHVYVVLAALIWGAAGCSPSVTAVNLDPQSKERKGIPFYLPKPYLVVTKNVRYVPSPTVGLTQTAVIPGSFDASMSELTSTLAQSTSRTETITRTVTETRSSETPPNGDGNKPPDDTDPPSNQTPGGTTPGGTTPGTASPHSGAAEDADEEQPGGTRVSDTPSDSESDAGGGSQVLGPTAYPVVPAASIADGLQPETFYTYHWVYLPDLTQKHGIRFEGGAGELRATMNLVNGWMYTGMGPTYVRNSTTASSIAAGGAALGSVVESVGRVGLAAMGIPTAASLPQPPDIEPQSGRVQNFGKIPDYAIIYIYEPRVVKNDDAPGGKSIEWNLVITQKFDRDVSGRAQPPQQPGAAAGPAAAPPGLVNAVQGALKTMRDVDGGAAEFVALEPDPKHPNKYVLVVKKALNDNDQKALLETNPDLSAVRAADATNGG